MLKSYVTIKIARRNLGRRENCLFGVDDLVVVEDVRQRMTEGHPSESVLVGVEDSGHGLDTVATERIFEAFYSTRSEGTGMGLAICRSIVEAHSGTLSARASAAGGAVLFFTIPI